MSGFLEKIEKLQRQIEILRPQAISELKTKLADARRRVVEIERQISKFSDLVTPAISAQQIVAPIGIMMEHRQIRERRNDQAPSTEDHPHPSPICHAAAIGEQREESHGQTSEHRNFGKDLRVIAFTRKIHETLKIGDNVTLRVRYIDDDVVDIGIAAPQEILIFRGEIYPGGQDQIRAIKKPDTEIEWEESYLELLAFWEEFGHLRLPIQNPDFRRLNGWLQEQKTRHTSLQPEQIRKLLALGVSLGAKETAWYRNFFDLEDYVKTNHAFPQGRTTLARWVEYQRTLKNKDDLPINRVRWLDSLGIVWQADTRRNVFAERLAELQDFKSKYGHCNVPWDYPENPTLGHYVSNNLRGKKENRSAEEVRELDALGFIWDFREELWQKHFAELKAFLEERPAFPTQLTNPNLAGWVRTQRKHPPSKACCKLLDGIGFPWNPREELWMARYLELKAYQQQFGHCNFHCDGKYQQLWKWLHFQKTCRTKLSPKRRKLLDQLGIDWSIEERFSTEDRMMELEAYYRRHGHCNVSIPEDRPLSDWLKTVRRRKDRLPATIKQKLESMGIDWSPLTTLWEQRFSEVAAFKERFGHCRIPACWEGNTAIATWLYTQKRRWDKLCEERQQRLSTLDPSIAQSIPAETAI